MNDEQTKAWIDEINRLHGTKLQADDPLLILPTLNKILMQDNHEQLKIHFNEFNEILVDQLTLKFKADEQLNKTSLSANGLRAIMQACLQEQQQILQIQLQENLKSYSSCYQSQLSRSMRNLMFIFIIVSLASSVIVKYF